MPNEQILPGILSFLNMYHHKPFKNKYKQQII